MKTFDFRRGDMDKKTASVKLCSLFAFVNSDEQSNSDISGEGVSVCNSLATHRFFIKACPHPRPEIFT